jgi:Family of unknown function (DUF6632)
MPNIQGHAVKNGFPDEQKKQPIENGSPRLTGGRATTSHNLLQFALVLFGAVFLLIYPLSIVWPSGWAWHVGAPYASDYFMMIVGVYATLGLFLINAARNPLANRSLIWFTIVSSVVHSAIMAAQSFGGDGHMHMGHLMGDVPALLLVAIVLSVVYLATARATAR